MKIVFIGDIVGRSGREALVKYIPIIRKDFNPDVIIVNAENASAGYGLTEKIANEFLDMGIDLITLGNHSWDQREMLSTIEKNHNILNNINLLTTQTQNRTQHKSERDRRGRINGANQAIHYPFCSRNNQ